MRPSCVSSSAWARLVLTATSAATRPTRVLPTWTGRPRMSSPFYGVDIGASALRAAQQLLDTAAHNVANTNTPGYSRQRVTVQASVPYTMPTFNRSGLPGQIGSGVSVMAITRVRDNFLDLQVQAQTALKSEWDTRQQELAKVESIFPEPSDSGLGSVISKYWNAWQDVAAGPTPAAARTALTA